KLGAGIGADGLEDAPAHGVEEGLAERAVGDAADAIAADVLDLAPQQTVDRRLAELAPQRGDGPIDRLRIELEALAEVALRAAPVTRLEARAGAAGDAPEVVVVLLERFVDAACGIEQDLATGGLIHAARGQSRSMSA